MTAKDSIKFFMMMQSQCPIFQWGVNSDVPIFEQLSMNISGFIGAFSSLITLLQGNQILKPEDKLDHVKFSQTHLIVRDNGVFQSIYIVESLTIRNQKSITQLMNKIDRKFLDMFGTILRNWDHNIEPFQEFNAICETLM